MNLQVLFVISDLYEGLSPTRVAVAVGVSEDMNVMTFFRDDDEIAELYIDPTGLTIYTHTDNATGRDVMVIHGIQAIHSELNVGYAEV